MENILVCNLFFILSFQKFKNPEDFKILDLNNINAKKEKAPGNNIQTSRAASKLSNRTGSSLWGKARAKLGLPAKPSMYVTIFRIKYKYSIYERFLSSN